MDIRAFNPVSHGAVFYLGKHRQRCADGNGGYRACFLSVGLVPENRQIFACALDGRQGLGLRCDVDGGLHNGARHNRFAQRAAFGKRILKI